MTFGILIIALSLMIYSMIKNAVISGAVCVIGEVALVIVYVVKSSVFEGGIQKVLEVFNLSSHFENFTNSIFDVCHCHLYIPYHADNFEETLELRRWGKCFLRRKMITILTITIKT